jgi:hypothetical protein
MTATKLFTVVGHSTRGDKHRTRVSAGKAEFRGKNLLKTGNTGVTLYDLPRPMTKVNAHKWLSDNLPTGIKPAFQG